MGILNEVKRYWQDKLGTDDELRFQGRRLFVVPERSPEEKPLYAAMGRMRETMEARRAALKPQPPWELDFFFRPGWKIQVKNRPGAPEKEVLADLAKSGVWPWNESLLQQLFGITSEA
eukprot:10406533-Lingulodinium_polyedra.AAC.1